MTTTTTRTSRTEFVSGRFTTSVDLEGALTAHQVALAAQRHIRLDDNGEPAVYEGDIRLVGKGDVSLTVWVLLTEGVALRAAASQDTLNSRARQIARLAYAETQVEDLTAVRERVMAAVNRWRAYGVDYPDDVMPTDAVVETLDHALRLHKTLPHDSMDARLRALADLADLIEQHGETCGEQVQYCDTATGTWLDVAAEIRLLAGISD